ncbi:cupin domain-containing protein [Streptomyces sp. R39]|uniref:Cupin domain-containing protein n=1 Tax=Streptomyces sp. R39 TaxID=3238631 RepID=A0AB39QI31_9ACTN
MTAGELRNWVTDVEAFTSEFWRQKPGVFHPAEAPRSPLSLADVDAVVAGGLLRTPHLEMTRASKVIPEEAYTTSRLIGTEAKGFADPVRVVEQLKDGATLLLRNTEQWHRPSAELARRLADELGRWVDAYYFVTPPRAQGLPLHRDDADVLLFQVEGSKTWVVKGGPGTANWRQGRVSGDPGPSLLETTLHPGDVLYIPRGHAHMGVGSEGLSMHLSLTIREVGALELVRAAPRLLLGGLKIAARPLDDETLLASAAVILDLMRARLSEVGPQELLDYARLAQRRLPLNVHDCAGILDYAGTLSRERGAAA